MRRCLLEFLRERDSDLEEDTATECPPRSGALRPSLAPRYLHGPLIFVTSPGTKKIKFLTRGPYSVSEPLGLQPVPLDKPFAIVLQSVSPVAQTATVNRMFTIPATALCPPRPSLPRQRNA